MAVSQRPSELGGTVLSQCRSLLAMQHEGVRPHAAALGQRMRYSSRMRDLDALKDSFDECYRKGWHASMIDTPVDERIRLPLHLAIGDLYADRGNSKGGEMFLAIYPIGSSGASSGLYEHRVIASRLCTDVLDTEGTFGTIRRLVDGVDASDNGTDEFLTELLGQTRNAFFSGDYEQKLLKQTRVAIERRVCDDVIDPLREFLPGP